MKRKWILLCVPPAVIGVGLALPNFLEAKKHGNEASAFKILHAVGTAQSLFREGDLEGDGVLDYGNLAELQAAGLLDDVLAGGVQDGYVFEVEPAPHTAEFLWMAVAKPLEPGKSGDRYFASNHEGVTYFGTKPIPLTPDGSMPPHAHPG